VKKGFRQLNQYSKTMCRVYKLTVLVRFWRKLKYLLKRQPLLLKEKNTAYK